MSMFRCPIGVYQSPAAGTTAVSVIINEELVTFEALGGAFNDLNASLEAVLDDIGIESFRSNDGHIMVEFESGVDQTSLRSLLTSLSHEEALPVPGCERAVTNFGIFLAESNSALELPTGENLAELVIVGSAEIKMPYVKI